MEQTKAGVIFTYIFSLLFTKTKVTKLFVGKDIYNGFLFECVSYYSLNFVKQKFRLCHFVAACRRIV